MAQMDEQQLHPGGDEAHMQPTIITTTGRGNTQEEDHDQDQDHDHDHHSKKSVLAKVKEKALKWKNTLAKKRHGHDNKGHETHSWEGNLDEEEKEEDPEYHGAPMYESERAPQGYKETSSPATAITNELDQPLAHKTNNSDVHSTTTNEIILTIRTNKEHKESEMAPETYKETSSPPTAITDGLKQPLAQKTNKSDLDRTTNEDMTAIRTNNEHKVTLPHHTNTPKAPFSTLDKELATPRAPHVPKASPFHQTNHPKVFTSPSKELAIKHADQLAMHYLDEFEASSPRYKRTHVKFEDNISDNDNAGTEHNALEVNATRANDPSSEAKEVIGEEVLGDGGSKLTVETSGNAKEQGSEAKVYDKAPDEEHSSSKTLTETVTGLLAPAYNMVSEATQAIASKIHHPSTEDEIGAKMTYDKGVSVKEYLMHKLEPGEDERALSRAITEAISPRKATVTRESGVVVKVRNAVSTLLRKEGSEASSIPVSTNPHAEVEETGGRRLQAYAN